MDLNFVAGVLEEVALEGLDGITLPMLWVRLENRPNFSIPIDDDSKAFLWECIAVHKDIEIFELPKPRPLIPLYNRYDHIDNELGIVLEPTEDLVDMYPVEMIKDANIRGSCPTYKSRKSITTEIRYDDVLLMTLLQVTEKWGEKLVLVASQRVRLLALIGTEGNPISEMTLEAYCLLERIGRSRYHGEVTQGEGGLLKLKAPFIKQLHYYRKKLTLKGLVTKQFHYMKSRKGIATTGSLFHLSKFFVLRKTKMELLVKCMCDALREKPKNMEACVKLRAELNIKETTFKKLLHKPFDKYFEVMTITVAEFNPQASQKESFTSSGLERSVKVVRLLKHCEDEDNADEEEGNDKNQTLPISGYFDCSKIFYEIPLILQVFRLIQDSGPEGLTAVDLQRKFTLPRLDIRSMLRVLLEKNQIVFFLHDRGRQKEKKYIAKNFGSQNEAYSNVEKEKEYASEELLGSNRKRKNEISNDADPENKKARLEEDNDKVLKTSDPNNSNKLEELKKSLSDRNKSDFQKIAVEIYEIQSYEAFTGTAPRLINMSDNIKKGKSISVTSSFALTYRKYKRIKMILDHLKESGFSTLPDLKKYLIDREREEGYNFTADKRSTARIIHWLHLQKKIKIVKAILKLDIQKAEMEFICDNSLKLDDPSLLAQIEQAKFRFFSISKDKTMVSDKNGISSKEMSYEPTKNDEKKRVHSLQNQKLIQGLLIHPKCFRFKTLHKFLYYLVYGYEGHAEDKSNEPSVYHDSMTWKRFVPPLPADRKDGWCFLADVYNRMPLIIFVKSVNLRDRIYEFEDYLVDKEKCNYLITHLPKKMFKSLFNSRKFIFLIDEVLKCLCYMGLVTFGPQIAKPIDQMHIYVHNMASIKDTSISPPGYLQINPDIDYETKVFTFNSLNDVEKFWVELEHVCSSTDLGRYSTVAGKTIAVTMTSFKPELLAALKRKNFDEVSDVGFIPGDGKGAGGYDSSLYLHTRRNWQSSNFKEKEKVLKGIPNAKSVITIQTLLTDHKKSGSEIRSRLQRLGQHNLESQKSKILKENVLKKNKSTESKKKNKLDSSKSSKISILEKTKMKTTFRTVKVRQKKERAPYMDDKDKAAVEKMSRSRSRCEWSAQEDSFLLLCKVASCFLDPFSRTLVVPCAVIRDLLQEKFPIEGSTKTSRSCQRRIRYMLYNPTTTNNVAVFLGEAKQDTQLVKDFDKPKPLKNNEAAWKELFTGVLKRLLEKFTLPASDRCKNVFLPNTIEEFKKMFVVLSSRTVFHYENKHKDPTNEEEIKFCILYALIVSAMALKQDGTPWPYLLHKLYHVYPDFLLKSAVSRLRGERVIACQKGKCKKDFKSFRMTTFPYRFSVTYENSLQTKFPIRLFHEGKDLLDELKNITTEAVTLEDNIPPGYTAAVLAFVLVNDITLTIKVPDQIILFDSTLSKEARTNIVERMMNSLSDKESDELARILNDEKDLPQNLAANDNPSLNDDQMHSESEKNYEENMGVNEVQRSTNASRFALYLLRQELSQPPIERVQHSQDYIVLNSCQVLCHPRNTGSGEIQDNNFTSQEDTLLPNNKKEPRGKILTDGCISEIKASLCTFIPPGAFNQYHNFDEPLEMIYDAYSLQTLNDAKSIFGEINKAGIIGISENNIWKMFKYLAGELSLFEHLHLFREAMLVIRAGVASFIYVSISYAKVWVLQSYVMPEKKLKTNERDSSTIMESMETEASAINSDSETEENFFSQNPENDNSALPDKFMENFDNSMPASDTSGFSAVHFTEEVYFLPRTWRHPDGTLNKKVFLKLLQTVLSYIMKSPGVSASRVTERFSLVLQPVQTLELLEILEKACCIIKYYCKKQKKGLLFSPLADIVISNNPQPDDFDHFESLPDAICNLTKIQEAIM